MVLPSVFLASLLTFTYTQGAYLITTPRRWTPGSTSEVCVSVKDANSPSGSLNVTLRKARPPPDEGGYTIATTTFRVPAGESNQCHVIAMPNVEGYDAWLHVSGTAGGAKVNHTTLVGIKRNSAMTFVQTDKYLYEPGQLVQIRILTVTGATMAISTEQYPEVWVTAPSGTRIAQWKNVSNTEGLVHLDLRLADEQEKGIYVLHVDPAQGREQRVNFKVEEFILPRFEVKIKEPPFILATDLEFTFTVCAKYTFGQKVKGNLSVSITNRMSGECEAVVNKTLTISGCREVNVTSLEMKINDCNVFSIGFAATVTEAGTEAEVEAGSKVYISRSAVSFSTEYKDKYRKPNLPYTIKLKAKLPDGSAAAGVLVESCVSGRCVKMTTPSDGSFTTVIPSHAAKSLFVKALNCRAYMNSDVYRQSLQNVAIYHSPSNSSLLIHASDQTLSCARDSSREHVLPLLFSARDQPSAAITVQVVSRGRIQHSSTKKFPLEEGPLPISTQHLVEPLPPPIPGTVRGAINITITLPPTASPTAQILVWYTREDGEVVSDARELKVEKCLGYDVSLKWSVAKAEPGEEAALTLTSQPESICSLGVVDKSVELLSKNPDPITLDTLFDFVDDFKIFPFYRRQEDDHEYCKRKLPKPGPSWSTYYDTLGYIDALSMFDDAGVYVFTNHTLETRPCIQKDIFVSRPQNFFGPVRTSTRPTIATTFPTTIFPTTTFLTTTAFATTTTTTTPSPSIFPTSTVEETEVPVEPDAPEVEAPRTNFPETWLWDLVVVPASGVQEQPVTVPDTITQWVGKAVCVHPQKGVGLSAREPITTFTPFFVDLTLPPTVKRGEILPVKMSVFNYLDQPLPVSVTLEESQEYEILDDESLESGGGGSQRGKRDACVPPQDKTVLTVKIKPLEIADVNISVSAVVDQQCRQECGAGSTVPERSDALIKPIKVEAEGFLRENTWTKYICAEDLASGDDTLESWELTLPETLVKGSARGWVTAVGDLLALSLENLGRLIRMPYGCGEQNMVNFAPNIYVLRYLDNTNQDTPEARSKLIKFMETGYRRELLYRRNDGSYSAFGNADDSGSTWLTAFVLKSFAQAQTYIQVDEDNQNETSAWLLQQQDENGCFKSVGKLLNKALQGGVSSSKTPTPLTAYVMAALVEAGEDPSSPPVALASRCLAADTSLHPYTLALKAYALALAKLPDAAEAVQQLMDLAIVTPNSTYWELPKGSGNSRAAALETAGYGILAMMTHDPDNMKLQARKVVKWITAQRNGQGGFYSTQDTVVALQAMALYESHSHQGPLNVQATVSGGNYSYDFTVNDDNKLLQQLEPLPYMPTTLTLTVAGQGCAVLQAVQRYNIPEPEASDAFDLTVNAITAPDIHCVTKRITACASYLLPDSKSNMVVIEVDLISGYIPEKQDLKQLLKDDTNIKRYEVDGSKVNFYINELTDKDTCVNFRVIRDVDVEQVKPGTVVVYDYYQPEFSISKRYSLPANDECR